MKALKSKDLHLFLAQFLSASQIELTEEESHHCVKVLRLQVGDSIAFFDGAGKKGLAIIENIKSKRVLGTIIEWENHMDTVPKLTLSIAPTKNIDRIEFMLEKTIEMGIDHVEFFFSERSERKTISLDRMQKIALAAAKQSRKYNIPPISVYPTLSHCIAQGTQTLQCVAALQPQTKELNGVYSGAESIRIFVGPEGDFSEKEYDLFHQNQFHSIALGKHRLRTETAGLVACAWVNQLFNSLPPSFS